ncbi:MAG TPA: hypothetical protein PKL85_05695 [Bacteroidia bacterium]|nr:hypothetical protein [Bacteroidia bacterium]
MSSVRHQIYQFRSEIRRSKGIGRKAVPPFSVWKYFFRWIKDQQPERNSVRDEMVWLTYPVIDFLRNYLKSSMKVFEYGGGGSTLFFAKYVSELITVEHDKEWFERLTEILNRKKIKHWTGKHISPEPSGFSGSPADPELYLSSDTHSENLSFQKYAAAIDQYPDGYFDLVLVDGRARPSCLFHSLSKVKKGGLLILDNAEREHYHEKMDALIAKDYTLILDGMAPVPFGEWFSSTCVWRKNA